MRPEGRGLDIAGLKFVFASSVAQCMQNLILFWTFKLKHLGPGADTGGDAGDASLPTRSKEVLT